MEDDVILSACGVVTPLSNEPDGLFEALLSGRSGISEIHDFPVTGLPCKMASRVGDVTTIAGAVQRRDARIMNTHSYMLMAAALSAYARGRLVDTQGDDIAFFAGMAMVDYEIDDLRTPIFKSLTPSGDFDPDKFYKAGFREIYPLWPLAMLNNIAFSQVAVRLAIKGESAVFSPHADAGARALIEGMRSVTDNTSSVCLAGGVSGKVTPLSLQRAVAADQTTGREIDQAIDQSAGHETSDPDIGVQGEGACVLLIEKSSLAHARGLLALARITGYGVTFGCNDATTGPDSRAIALAMNEAMERAAISAGDVDVVIAWASGVPSEDQNELKALVEVFGGRSNPPVIYTSRLALGNLLAGAAPMDVMIAAYMIRTGLVPPLPEGLYDKVVLTYQQATGFVIQTGCALSLNIKRVLVNAFSPEGQAVSLIVEGV